MSGTCRRGTGGQAHSLQSHPACSLSPVIVQVAPLNLQELKLPEKISSPAGLIPSGYTPEATPSPDFPTRLAPGPSSPHHPVCLLFPAEARAQEFSPFLGWGPLPTPQALLGTTGSRQ